MVMMEMTYCVAMGAGIRCMAVKVMMGCMAARGNDVLDGGVGDERFGWR